MKNAVLLIVGVLIGLAMGIFGGYYYFENFSDKKFSKEVKQEEKKKEEPKEETKVWTDEEVQNILSLFFKKTYYVFSEKFILYILPVSSLYLTLSFEHWYVFPVLVSNNSTIFSLI